ncbi:MAG: hypothetical protein WA782_19130 [Sulfitobacter sp.]
MSDVSYPWKRFADLNNAGFLVHRSLSGAKMNKKPGIPTDAADKRVKNIRREIRQT